MSPYTHVMNTILSKVSKRGKKVDPQWWLQLGHWGLSFTLKLMAIHDMYIKSFPLLSSLLYFTAQCVISQKPGKMNWRPIHKAQQNAYNPIHQMKRLRGPIQCRVELGQDSRDEEGNWRQFFTPASSLWGSTRSNTDFEAPSSLRSYQKSNCNPTQPLNHNKPIYHNIKILCPPPSLSHKVFLHRSTAQKEACHKAHHS